MQCVHTLHLVCSRFLCIRFSLLFLSFFVRRAHKSIYFEKKSDKGTLCPSVICRRYRSEILNSHINPRSSFFFWLWFLFSLFSLSVSPLLLDHRGRGRTVVEVGFPDCPFTQPSPCTGLITLSPSPPFPHRHLLLLLPLPQAAVLCRPVPMAKPPRNLISWPGSFPVLHVCLPAAVHALCMCVGVCVCVCSPPSYLQQCLSLSFCQFVCNSLHLEVYWLLRMSVHLPPHMSLGSWPGHVERSQCVLMCACQTASFSTCQPETHGCLCVFLSISLSLLLCVSSSIAVYLHLCLSTCFSTCHLTVHAWLSLYLPVCFPVHIYQLVYQLFYQSHRCPSLCLFSTLSAWSVCFPFAACQLLFLSLSQYACRFFLYFFCLPY